MSNGSILRRIGSASVAGAAAVAVLAPSASALAPTAAPRATAETLVGKLTVKQYVDYLKAQKGPAAKATLKAFRALPKAKQQKFVGHLQNRAIYQAFTASLKGTTRFPVQRVKVPYNADVTFVREIRVAKTKGIVGTDTRIAFTMTEQIFGISVTSEQVWVKYRTRPHGWGASKLLGGGASVSNVNAAVRIAGDGVRTQLVRGSAHVETTWKATPRIDSFGKGLNKKQYLYAGVNGTWASGLHNV
ncbi:hypothetical protein AB0C96_10340 [Streptomyces sp. NPDC048506]|uniref:hypothetical protein n=1 Tax=Streptomyces sp. NPDC048506 TaxID=3155028 RepID=UPI0034135106